MARNRIRHALSDLEQEAWLDTLEQAHLEIEEASPAARVWWREVRSRSVQQQNVPLLIDYVSRLHDREASIERMFQRAMRLAGGGAEASSEAVETGPNTRCHACGRRVPLGQLDCTVCGQDLSEQHVD